MTTISPTHHHECLENNKHGGNGGLSLSPSLFVTTVNVNVTAIVINITAISVTFDLSVILPIHFNFLNVKIIIINIIIASVIVIILIWLNVMVVRFTFLCCCCLAHNLGNLQSTWWLLYIYIYVCLDAACKPIRHDVCVSANKVSTGVKYQPPPTHR